MACLAIIILYYTIIECFVNDMRYNVMVILNTGEDTKLQLCKKES